MQSLVMLSINGSTFFFEDENFTVEQKEHLNRIAKEDIKYTSEYTDVEILNLFIKISSEKLNIQLKNVKISFIIRIDQNA